MSTADNPGYLEKNEIDRAIKILEDLRKLKRRNWDFYLHISALENGEIDVNYKVKRPAIG
ncbi:MAG: hypothetical protein OXB93_02125 [Cytophagales bacterium]|nr:hypothetical protein [Cytophagales bacterium]